MATATYEAKRTRPKLVKHFIFVTDSIAGKCWYIKSAKGRDARDAIKTSLVVTLHSEYMVRAFVPGSEEARDAFAKVPASGQIPPGIHRSLKCFGCIKRSSPSGSCALLFMHNVVW